MSFLSIAMLNEWIKLFGLLLWFCVSFLLYVKCNDISDIIAIQADIYICMQQMYTFPLIEYCWFWMHLLS